MRTRVPALARAAALVAALACGSTRSVLRPADPAQAADDVRATADAGGVRLAVRAGDWRGYPAELQSRLTPVQVELRNGSGEPLRVDAAEFALVLPDGSRRPAMSPDRFRRELPRLLPPPVSESVPGVPPAAVPGRPVIARGYAPYSWPGLVGPGPRDPQPTGTVGPDPRPSPSGVLAPGASASVLLYFDVPADSLDRVTFEAALEREGGPALPPVRIPFARR